MATIAASSCQIHYSSASLRCLQKADRAERGRVMNMTATRGGSRVNYLHNVDSLLDRFLSDGRFGVLYIVSYG